MNVLTPSPSYGADPSGLICGYLIEPASGTRPIDAAEAASRLTTPADATGFAWLHFNLAHTGALPWLRAHAGLPGEFYEMLDDGLHRREA